jgi:exosortase A-associated hydrolase 2
VNEEYRFLELNGERIFAALHRPVRPTAQAVVMCHPLGEEKLWAHRVFVSFARDLAAAGFAVLRFDFRGEGDSDRSFEDVDFETRIEDACLAVDAAFDLNSGVTDITLLGLRLGASVAAVAAMRREGVSRLVLWDPVVDGSAYMQNVLRMNLMFQMGLHHKVLENRDALVARLARGETVNIEGYELTEALFRQVSDFRLGDVLPRFAGETLIVQISPSETPAKPELVELAERTGRVRLEIVHEESFWKEIRTFCQRAHGLTRVTLRALEAAK